MEKQRPIINIEPSNLDKFLKNISLVCLLMLIFIPLYYWGKLPEQIPTHFDIKGKVDAQNHKYFIWLLPVVGIVVYFTFKHALKIPHKFNYLVKITEENAQQQYTSASKMIIKLQAIILLLCAYITWSTVRVSIGEQISLGKYIPSIFIVTTLLITGGGLLGLFVRKSK